MDSITPPSQPAASPPPQKPLPASDVHVQPTQPPAALPVVPIAPEPAPTPAAPAIPPAGIPDPVAPAAVTAPDPESPTSAIPSLSSVLDQAAATPGAVPLAATTPIGVNLQAAKRSRNWLLAVIILVVILLLAGGGYYAVATQHLFARKVAPTPSPKTATGTARPAKQNYTSAVGGFGAWFPSTPTQNSLTGSSIPGDTNQVQATTDTWTLETSASNYEVEVTPIPAGVTTTPAQVAAGLLANAASNGSAYTVLSGVTALLNGSQAYKSVNKQVFAGKTTYVTQAIILQSGKLYIVSAETLAANDASAAQFINNFSLN